MQIIAGENFFEGVLKGAVQGTAWAIGIANREFNTDGTIEYDKNGNLKGVQDGDLLAFTSATPSNSSNDFYETIGDWLWSTLVGGYSHVSTVDDGRIYQYGKSYGSKKYSGRHYKIIGNKSLYNSTETRIDPNKPGLSDQQRAKYYSRLTNNCSTSLAKGLGISHQWAPYNIYSYFNNAQFAWGDY